MNAIAELPKIVFTDIDGVWTDGSMYYSDTGIELKRFNTADSVGVLMLRKLNIPLCILTGENSPIVKFRSEKLKIDHVRLGVKNKLKEAKSILADFNLSLHECAFIGDSIIDIPLLRAVQFSACPANAPDYVKSEVKFCTQLKGGDGAFADFVGAMLQKAGCFEKVLAQLIEDNSNQ